VNARTVTARTACGAARRGWLIAAGAGSLAVAAALLGVRRLGLPGTSSTSGEPPAELCIVAPALPYDPASGLPAHAPRPVPAHARCPVCGMYPARDLRWAAQVIYTDGAVHFFDSPLTLYQFLHDMDLYGGGRSTADITGRWVTDIETGQWIDADRAFHVHGSDALGPMRAGNLPAFATSAAAQRFALARGGRVLPAAAIDRVVLRELENRGRHSH
jgi:nitrous oxide reductase accessory protein NosL